MGRQGGGSASLKRTYHDPKQLLRNLPPTASYLHGSESEEWALMAIRMITDETAISGTEPLIRPLIDYLGSRGLPAREIQSVTLRATVGEPIMIDVTLFAQTKKSDPRCPRCGRGADEHFDETRTNTQEVLDRCDYSRQLLNQLIGGENSDDAKDA